MAQNTPVETHSSPESLPALPAPLGRTLICVVIVFIIACIITAWAQKSIAPVSVGYLRSHEIAFVAPFDARLMSQHVVEGEEVKPGTALFTLIDENLERKQKAKQQQIATLRAEVQKAEAKAKIDLAWRLKNLESELLETKLKSASLLKEQYMHQLEEIARSETKASPIEVASLTNEPIGAIKIQPKTGNGDRIQASLQRAASQNAIEVLNSQVELCFKRTNELESLKKELPDTIKKATGIDLLQQQLKTAKSEYDQLALLEQTRTISSPAYGLTGQYQLQIGETIRKDEPVVKVLDNAQRHITLDVPADKVHQYELGEVLALRFPNGEKSKGEVYKIAPHVTAPEELSSTTERGSYVRLWLKPAHQTWPESPIGSPIQVKR